MILYISKWRYLTVLILSKTLFPTLGTDTKNGVLRRFSNWLYSWHWEMHWKGGVPLPLTCPTIQVQDGVAVIERALTLSPWTKETTSPVPESNGHLFVLLEGMRDRSYSSYSNSRSFESSSLSSSLIPRVRFFWALSAAVWKATLEEDGDGKEIEIKKH